MPLLIPMAGLPPLVIEQTEISNQPVPEGRIGAWITLTGQGGSGGIGTHVVNDNQNATGGRGGSGGSRIGRSFVPISAMGLTYSLTAGTTSSRVARFTSGSVVLSAGWGANASTSGGTASATGYTTDIYLANGRGGGAGGTGTGDGTAGTSATNGAGAGGGGGGGGRSQNITQGSGGAGGVSTGGDPPGPAGLGKNGGHGSSGHHSGSTADGGVGGAGGGIAYVKVEWV